MLLTEDGMYQTFNKTRSRNDEQDDIVCNLLVKLVSKNEELIHLDLSSTGLTGEILISLIKPIKQSLSLIGIHLSGNPGITD